MQPHLLTDLAKQLLKDTAIHEENAVSLREKLLQMIAGTRAEDINTFLAECEKNPAAKKQAAVVLLSLYNLQLRAFENNPFLQKTRKSIIHYQQTQSFTHLIGIPFDLTEIPNETMSLVYIWKLLQTSEAFLSKTEQELSTKLENDLTQHSYRGAGDFYTSIYFELKVFDADNILERLTQLNISNVHMIFSSKKQTWINRFELILQDVCRDTRPECIKIVFALLEINKKDLTAAQINAAFFSACAGGDRESVKLMLAVYEKKQMRLPVRPDTVGWSAAFSSACENGCDEVIKLILPVYVKEQVLTEVLAYNNHEAFLYACQDNPFPGLSDNKAGRDAIVRQLIDIYLQQPLPAVMTESNEALKWAFATNHQDFAKALLEVYYLKAYAQWANEGVQDSEATFITYIQHKISTENSSASVSDNNLILIKNQYRTTKAAAYFSMVLLGKEDYLKPKELTPLNETEAKTTRWYNIATRMDEGLGQLLCNLSCDIKKEFISDTQITNALKAVIPKFPSPNPS